MEININGYPNCQDFIEKYIPNILISLIKENLNEVDKAHYNKMNNYLVINYKFNINYIMSLLRSNIVVLHINDKNHTIKINENTKIGNNYYIDILKLLEFGSLEIDGLDFIFKSFRRIQDKIDDIYRLYIIQGGK